ncbi:MAG: hypothetical protein EBX55_04995 [Betaproteobacteria bacterium]|nr:hypothetical protein [Betaproteobacteria bacterium]
MLIFHSPRFDPQCPSNQGFAPARQCVRHHTGTAILALCIALGPWTLMLSLAGLLPKTAAAQESAKVPQRDNQENPDKRAKQGKQDNLQASNCAKTISNGLRIGNPGRSSVLSTPSSFFRMTRRCNAFISTQGSSSQAPRRRRLR